MASICGYILIFPTVKSRSMGMSVRHMVLYALVVLALVPVVHGCGESAPAPASESVGAEDVPGTIATPVSTPVVASALSPTATAVPSASAPMAMAVYDAS